MAQQQQRRERNGREKLLRLSGAVSCADSPGLGRGKRETATVLLDGAADDNGFRVGSGL